MSNNNDYEQMRDNSNSHNDNSSFYDNIETSFTIKNKNETDFKSFNEFFKERDKSHNKIVNKTSKEQLKANIVQWDKSVPHNYARLSLKQLDTTKNKTIIQKVKNAHSRNLFIYSNNPEKREKIAYAILRDYVSMGFTSFSRVEHITENDITLWGTVGFEGYKKIDNLLSQYKTNTIVIHGFSDKNYTEKELRMLEKIINHCFYNNIKLVFVTGIGLGFFKKALQEETYAALHSMVGKNVISLLS